MLDRKIWKLFRLRGNGWNKRQCDWFFCLTFDFIDFCIFSPCFFYTVPLPMMWILFKSKLISFDLNKVHIIAKICDHSLFTLQFSYIEKLIYRSTGYQCSHNKLPGYIGPQCLGTALGVRGCEFESHQYQCSRENWVCLKFPWTRYS